MTASQGPVTDPFGLSSAPLGPRWIVQIGGADVSSALIDGELTAQMRAIPTAKLVFDGRAALLSAIDFASDVTITQSTEHGIEPRFSGQIIAAKRSGKHVEVTCSSAPGFIEREVGSTAHTGCNLDLIYMLAREGGFTDSAINMEGLDRPTLEIFEVAIPVDGVATRATQTTGDVTFVHMDNYAMPNAFVDLPLSKQFRQASTCAVTYVTAARVYDAEQEGRQRVDLALAWLTVQSRYSLAVMPSGQATQKWSRDSILIRPKALSVVTIRGLRTGRSWIRELGDFTKRTDLTITLGQVGLGNLPSKSTLPAGLRQAVLASARAATQGDPMARVTAIWEAIEFYVGATKVPEMFTRQALREIRKSLPVGLPERKASRLRELIGNLNNPPLLVRLRHRIALDGVPISADEYALLVALRSVRNGVAHGREVEPPTDEELMRGVAVVCRMIVHAVCRLGATQ